MFKGSTICKDMNMKLKIHRRKEVSRNSKRFQAKHILSVKNATSIVYVLWTLNVSRKTCPFFIIIQKRGNIHRQYLWDTFWHSKRQEMQHKMDAHLKDCQSKYHDQGHLYNQDKQLGEDVGQENLEGRDARGQAPIQETFLLLYHKR